VAREKDSNSEKNAVGQRLRMKKKNRKSDKERELKSQYTRGPKSNKEYSISRIAYCSDGQG
jgi:hypothetical protein